MNRLDAHQDVFTDLSTLENIRSKGRESDAEGIKEVAKKFESMFVHMMLKSMREASKPFESEGFGNSFESDHHRDMYDQQLALSMTSGRGIGIADSLSKQLMGQYGIDNPDAQKGLGASSLGNNLSAYNAKRSRDALGSSDLLTDRLNPTVKRIETVLSETEKAQQQQEDFADKLLFDEPLFGTPQKISVDAHVRVDVKNSVVPTSSSNLASTVSIAPLKHADHLENLNQSPDSFVKAMYPAAIQAATTLGVDPKVLVAQAALETGWGKHISTHKDGDSSFNLFNIKADNRWDGDQVRKETIEYRQGQPLREVASFRSYDSYQHSFNDYVDFIKTSSRYQNTLQHSASPHDYMQGLQDAGYATDPKYTEKVIRIMNSDYLSGYSASSSVASRQDNGEGSK